MGTPILNLHQYDNAQDFDYNDVNADYSQIDTLPPTVCTSGTRPTSNLYTNRMIWETDTSRLMMWTGTAWTNISDQGAWLDFTPLVYTQISGTPSSITRTVNSARYKVLGKTCFAYADISIGVASTTGGVGVDLPLIAKNRVIACGNAALYGATTPADQSGIACMSTSKDKLQIIAYTNGVRDVTAASTALRYNVQYELP